MKTARDFNLFASFATSELTHSGVWGWVLQSLDDDCPVELHELRPLARALLARMRVEDFTSPIAVSREQRLAGDAGRVDIEVEDGQGRFVVIETKVNLSPDAAQLQRYEAAYRAAGRKLVGATILSTTFDEPWNDIGPKHIGATDLLDLLQKANCQNEIMRQYRAWLDNTIAIRQEAIATALGPDPARAREALAEAPAQWGVMRQLGFRVGGPGRTRLYADQNRNGSRWTQLAFSPGRSPDFDALHYRIDTYAGGSAEFTLRQYQNPMSPGKVDRLEQLRAAFSAAATKAGDPLRYDTSPKYAKTRVREAKVMQLTIPDATPSAILEHLPRTHVHFLEWLRERNWPLEPGNDT